MEQFGRTQNSEPPPPLPRETAAGRDLGEWERWGRPSITGPEARVHTQARLRQAAVRARPRIRAICAWSDSDGSPPAGYLGDLYAYEPGKMVWTTLSPPLLGAPPPPRGGHGFDSMGGLLYVHGGIGPSGACPGDCCPGK